MCPITFRTPRSLSSFLFPILYSFHPWVSLLCVCDVPPSLPPSLPPSSLPPPPPLPVVPGVHVASIAPTRGSREEPTHKWRSSRLTRKDGDSEHSQKYHSQCIPGSIVYIRYAQVWIRTILGFSCANLVSHLGWHESTLCA